jgi:serine/threonine protein kinase
MEVSTILNYTIKEELNTLARSKAYLALDAKTGTRVVVKELHAGIRVNDIVKEEVLAELDLVMRLRHPHIASLLEYKETKRGITLVMDWVEGQTLEEYVAEHGPLEDEVATHIFCKVLDAVSYAHQRNVIHLSLKPSNIIIGKDGNIKVLDFGMARLTSLLRCYDERSNAAKLLYLSPEQVKRVIIDKRSDIYTLGVMMFQVLTGKAPYAVDGFENDMYRRVINETLPPVASVRESVSERLQAAVLKATYKDPSKRFQTAESFLKAIDTPHRRRHYPKSYQTILPDGESRPPIPQVQQAFWRKHQNLISGIFICFLLGSAIFTMLKGSGVHTEAELSAHTRVSSFFDALAARDTESLQAFFEPEVDRFYQHHDYPRQNILVNYQKFWQSAPEERFTLLPEKLRIVQQNDGTLDVTAVVKYNVVVLKPYDVFSYDAFEYQTKLIETEAAREITYKLRLNNDLRITYIRESRNRELPGKVAELLTRKWRLVRFYDKDIAHSVNTTSDRIKYQLQKLVENNYIDFRKDGRYEESVVLSQQKYGTWKLSGDAQKVHVKLPGKENQFAIVEIGRNYLITSRHKEGKEIISIYKPYE